MFWLIFLLRALTQGTNQQTKKCLAFDAIYSALCLAI